MQVRLVERNRIDENVSNVSVEDIGSSDEVFVVRIRPNMYRQLKPPFLRNHLALPITQRAGSELVRRKRPLDADAVSPISCPIPALIIHRPGRPFRDFAAEIEIHNVERQVYPGAGRPRVEDYWIALHPALIADEVHIWVFPLNVFIDSNIGRCRLTGEQTRFRQTIGAYANGHYDVTVFRHLSNPIQHLRRSGRSRDHYHLWFRSIRVRIVRYDSHSARDPDRIFTVSHSIKLKEFQIRHAHPGRGKANGVLEGHPGADKINRLSPSPDDEGDRYLAVGWRNQFGGRHGRRARRLLVICQPRERVENDENDENDGQSS